MGIVYFTLEFIVTFAVGFLFVAPILTILALAISIMGYAICRQEGWAKSDALYYAFITATTVGYGDFTPRKRRTRALAVATAFCGLVLGGIVVSVAVNAVTVTLKNSSYRPKIVSDYLRKTLNTDQNDKQDVPIGKEL